MAAQYDNCRNGFIVILLFTCAVIQTTCQDFSLPYDADISNRNYIVDDVVLLGNVRLKRDTTNNTTSNTVPKDAPLNVVSIIPKKISPIDFYPDIVPTWKPLTTQRNLGENGTGIRQVNKCQPGGENSNATVICVSDPIVPEDGNSSSPDVHLNEFSEPQEKLFADNNVTKSTQDTHDYYNSTTLTDKDYFDEYWTSILNSGDVVTHEVLSDAFKRISVLQLPFMFPFYGHNITNVTIATSGFIYTGEYYHSWLAATQYIAPLMASFDTHRFNDSFVKYIMNGTALTIIWENVALTNKDGDSRFTFASTMHSNGDITFAYKSVPFAIETLLDETHPVKVGLSDAFVIDSDYFFVRRKTIYEYHRVDFINQSITNNTVIKFKALSTCLQYTSCETCLTHDTLFECSWCPKMNKCSRGVDRQKQAWILNKCDIEKILNVTMCSVDTTAPIAFVPVSVTPGYVIKKNSSAVDAIHAARVELSGNEPKIGRAQDSGVGSQGAIIGGLLVLIAVGGIGSWFVYAYRNPHTNSGQILVKYRPSQWSWRRGEARYTAATIHM